MRKLLIIDDTLANKISFYHLLLLLVSLPFDYFFSHIIIASYAIHLLIHFKKSEVKPIITLRTLALQSVFLVTLVATTYSSYKTQAFNDLGRQLVILILPILFCIGPLDIKKYKGQLLQVFALCCTLTVIYLYLHAMYVLSYFHYPIKLLFSHAFTNHNFSEPIGMHATFLSLQLAMALMVLLLILLKETKLIVKLFYAFCCVALAAGLIQLSSKSVVAVMAVAIVFILPFYTMTGRKRLLWLTTGTIISLVAITTISRSDTFHERFINSFTKDLTPRIAPELVDSRITRWRVVVGLIKQSPVIGYGSGSEIPMLKDAFFEEKLYDSYLNGLNAHNEYLSFWFRAGIGGLVIYLLTLMYGFKAAFKTKDMVFITFMLLIAVVSLSEDVFDVDKGTMFYGWFFSFFIFSAYKAPLPKRMHREKNILVYGQPVC